MFVSFYLVNYLEDTWRIFRSTPRECLTPSILAKLIINAKAVKRSIGDKQRGYSNHHALLKKELESEGA